MSPQPVPLIILAAGQGKRLGEFTAECPKCLIPVNGQSLLARQVAIARSIPARLNPLVVVTGFHAEKIHDELGSTFTPCHNDQWQQANNIVSLATAAQAGWLEQGFVLANSDVLFHPTILHRLLAFQHPNALVIDDKKLLGDEEMKVFADSQGRLHAISKSLSPSEAFGEYIGLAKFNATGAQIIQSALAQCLAQGRTSDWYEAAFQVAFSQLPIYACSTEGLPWTEVDTPKDLEEAHTIAALLSSIS